MLNKEMKHLFEGEKFRLILMDGQKNDPEGGLHLGMFIKLIEDDLGHLVPFQLDDHPHPFPVRFVANIGNPLDHLLLNQFSDFFDELGLIGLIGKFGDNNVFTFAFSIPLDDRPGSKLDHALSGFIGLANSLSAVDESRLWGSRVREDDPSIPRERYPGLSIRAIRALIVSAILWGGILVAIPTAIPEEPLTMRFGNLDGRTEGSTERVVVIRDKIDRFLIDVCQQLGGELGHADLGISHGRRGIAINGAEISLAVDQRITEREILGHSDNGIINRHIAVGMIFTDDIADDSRRFLVGFIPIVAELIHGVKNAAMNGFKTIPAHPEERGR